MSAAELDTVRIHRSTDHLMLLDRGVITNPALSYGAIGLYAYLESLDGQAFAEYVGKNPTHPLLQELLAEGVYRMAAQ